jgi:hypothetical protein
MKKNLTIAIVLFLSILTFQNSYASHIVGGDISYTNTGAGQYKITVNLFRDCAGLAAPASITIDMVSSCGNNLTAVLPLVNPGGTQVSQICAAQLANSSCSGGALPGIQQYTYEDIVTLPVNCNSWTFSYSNCCRGTSVNLVGTANFFISATLNSVTSPANNSPKIVAPLISYFCANQAASYSFEADEVDGNLLVYSLVGASSSAGTTITYNSGYSGSVPIPGITMSSTGQLNFTPTMMGVYTIVVQVSEYNSSSQLVGVTQRDVIFNIINCTNTEPSASGGQISGLTGNATPTGSFSLDVTEGNSFTFNAVFSDANAGNVLNLSSNILTDLPGSTMSTSGTNPLTATISWTAPSSAAGKNNTFTLLVFDDACPISGEQSFSYSINVLDGSVVWPGDANNDLVANNTDLLNIGIGYGTNGHIRVGGNNSYTAQNSTLWANTFGGGLNYNYADCNGDSTIDDDDTLAISLNYGLTHLKTEENNATDASPPLKLVFTADTVLVDSVISVHIKLGTPSLPATNIYGLAFSINYNAALIKENSCYIIFSPSWMGTIGSNMISLQKDLYANSKIDAALTRTNHSNVSGNGDIGTLYMHVKDDVSGKEYLTKTLSLTLSNVLAIDNTGTATPLSLEGADVVIEQGTATGIEALQVEPNVRVYPNPAKDNLYISLSGFTEAEVKITNLNGQTVFNSNEKNATGVNINTSSIAGGIYMLQVSGNGNQINKKISIIK